MKNNTGDKELKGRYPTSTYRFFLQAIDECPDTDIWRQESVLLDDLYKLKLIRVDPNGPGVQITQAGYRLLRDSQKPKRKVSGEKTTWMHGWVVWHKWSAKYPSVLTMSHWIEDGVSICQGTAVGGSPRPAIETDPHCISCEAMLARREAEE
jgi:hypothetical protein